MQNVQQYLAERKEIKQGRRIALIIAIITVLYFGAHLLAYIINQ